MADARTYDTAARRWEGIGPYYAMFPTSFADRVVATYTNAGDTVLDPFAGRGTAVFSAAHQGRQAVGIEINPVGWVYGKAKLCAAAKNTVRDRLLDLGRLAAGYREDADNLPTFFHHCFSQSVREFLLAARANLTWRHDDVDRTVMALLLVCLHGKRNASLSNQMRQTKSMAPDYAIRWWQERELSPPDLDPVQFMVDRLDWRYAKGAPQVDGSDILLGNSEQKLSEVKDTFHKCGRKAHLLLTSPPYFALTNYHYDQWLRLWLLGGPPTARRISGNHEMRGKFENSARYRELLLNVFQISAQLMAPSSTVYVRTGVGPVTFDTTLQVLKEIFPRHKLTSESQPYTRPTQTSLFGDATRKAGEVDFVLTSER